MNKERYKYTQNIEQITDFKDFCKVEKQIDAEKSLFSDNGNGYSIDIDRNCQCNGVITIDLRYETGRNYKIENIVKLASNSSLRLVIYHHSADNVQIKDSLTVDLANHSRLEIVEIVDTHSLITSNISVTAHRNSIVEITTLDLNNTQVIRNQLIELLEPGAQCRINGLYITGESDHVDNYVKINHTAPQCTSNQLFKGVLSGNSTAAFTGEIYVAKDAQKSTAYQENHNILLSDLARVYTRPQLEIYADDVKCNHGATVGRPDNQALYYMRQRGIPLESARRLQLIGFVEDVVKISEFGDLQSLISQKIALKLASI